MFFSQFYYKKKIYKQIDIEKDYNKLKNEDQHFPILEARYFIKPQESKL